MKVKKNILLSSVLSSALFLIACGGGGQESQPITQQPPAQTNNQGNQIPEYTITAVPLPVSPENFTVNPNDPRLLEHGLDTNLRFIEPRTISVGLWDRSHDRIPNFADSYWAQWVADEILATHNIIVEWVPIPRWDEPEFQSTLLAAGQAPDISYTFQNPMVTTFANMGGITNMYPLLQQYRDLLPNLYDLLQENVYWNFDPTTNELWSLTGRLVQDGRVNTFIREDWLNTLGLPIPTTLEEFENTLIAFRDNAEVLLGADAANISPFRLEHDVAWSAGLIFESFIPNDITEREWFRYGFDDRRFMFRDAAREATRVLNRWFNEGLLYNDFFLHPAGTPIVDDQIRLGRVGAFIQSWDMPFRPAEALITDMRLNVGPEANFIAIAPFTNDVGIVRKFFPNPTDRFIYFPITNTEPLASLLYLDFISRLDVREFLQFGIEGIHRLTLENGAIQTLAESDGTDGTPVHIWPNHQFIPSLRNFDITITVNGIDLGDPYITAATLALGYPGIEPAAVMQSRSIGLDNAYWFRQIQTRQIASEEGMTAPLADQRDVILHQLIVATNPNDFDATFDAMYSTYLALGAQAIINERDAAWVETFGDVDTMP
ncbi:MAG: sugar ABC transporter substrate-binding protein [Defluviitaleaceae bacterium]|nr:sugar ABC transporter substrate-binding protein [Defluviitaleaceae bacterium]